MNWDIIMCRTTVVFSVMYFLVRGRHIYEGRLRMLRRTTSSSHLDEFGTASKKSLGLLRACSTYNPTSLMRLNLEILLCGLLPCSYKLGDYYTLDGWFNRRRQNDPSSLCLEITSPRNQSSVGVSLRSDIEDPGSHVYVDVLWYTRGQHCAKSCTTLTTASTKI
jgi:hypothetical protein